MNALGPLWTCNQADCSVALDGECVEGHALEDCPHGSRRLLDLPGPADTESSDIDAAEDVASLVRMVSLFSGAELDAGEVRLIMAGSLARVIVVAGMPAVGKTTLLATLYQMFHAGPVDGYLFAGSRTQLAFEERCHAARSASKRSSPETERTRPIADVHYLHLSVRDEGLVQDRTHILITDISGEIFRDAVRNSAAGAESLPVLKRADHFVLLLDAEQLASAAERQRAFADGRQVLRSCIESGMIGVRTRVQVVFSRWDKANQEVVAGSTNEYIARIEAQLRDQFAAQVAAVSFHRIAARPAAESTLSAGYGVGDLLRSWAENSELDQKPARRKPTALPTDREALRFAIRLAVEPTREPT
jgi:thymidylate kinase